MQWEVLVDAAKTGNEVVLERSDGAFGSVAAMDAWWDKLLGYVAVIYELLENLRAFVIESLEFGSESGSSQSCM